jgi:hypothetical protein
MRGFNLVVAIVANQPNVGTVPEGPAGGTIESGTVM